MKLQTALKAFNKLPWRIKIELLFYPLYLFFKMPFAWIRSLWAARILLNGEWHRYMGFDPANAINNLFYRTQWINLDRYGRSGVSPFLGLGDYPLKNWFHLSLLSSYIFSNAGAVTTLLGTLIWACSHFIWIDNVGGWWVFAVTVTLLFSTTSYSMAFARQNYQILGWMGLPAALHGVLFEQWALATLTWFAISIAGITPIFFAVPIMATISILNQTWMPIVVLIPAIVLTSSRFLPLLKDSGGGFASALFNVAKLIGVTNRKVRYHREMNRLSMSTFYFICLYLGLALLFWIFSGELPIFLFLGVILFLVNERFFRVADEQSLILINASLWTAEIIKYQNEWSLFLLFWLAINPSGLFLSIQQLTLKKDSLNIKVRPPFDTSPILDKIKAFLSVVGSGQSIYSAFNDPQGKYAKIFDGYRIIHEAYLCAAAENKIHLFPDWYAVAETNYEGAPQCWGRSIDEVQENCTRWGAGFALIYQESGSSLSYHWLGKFKLVAEFDWADEMRKNRDPTLLQQNKFIPKWFLLKKI